MVLGIVKDKNHAEVFKLLPKEATYIFCQAKIPRAMDATALAAEAGVFGLSGEVVPDVNDALQTAFQKATSDDLIFVGGSTFVVAELENL